MTVASEKARAQIQVRPVPLPREASVTSRFSRIDYFDAFVVNAATETGPEGWARAMIQDAPLHVRLKLLAGWASLGLRLGSPWASDRVLGWRVRQRTARTVVLEARSPLGLRAELHFHARGQGVLFATLIRTETALARRVWRLMAPTHRGVVASLLRDAARRESSVRPSDADD